MSNAEARIAADVRWVEAMLADLQRQIDQLAGELRALSQVVNAQTLASLKGTPATDTGARPPGSEEADDGQ